MCVCGCDNGVCVCVSNGLPMPIKGEVVEWILKPTDNSAHNGRGILIFPARCVYEALKNNLLIGRHAQMQMYIPNPLLIDNRKFDLRVYMLIANVSPALILYHDGIIRLSYDDYKSNSFSQAAHITNVERVKHKPGVKLSNYVWSFQTLQNKLTQEGLAPKDWVFTTLRTKLKKIIRECWFATRQHMSTRPKYFALQGVDVLIDSNLRPWLLEIQKSPSMDPGGSVGATDSIPFKRNLIRQLWHGTVDTLDSIYKQQIINIFGDTHTHTHTHTNNNIANNHIMATSLQNINNWKCDICNSTGWEVVINQFDDYDIGPPTPNEFPPLPFLV
eukprot:GHVR01119026.1.p1 GENE.GHVR01119026.1~~GHVR01119026.1.p1  ORF type:complete len:371 (+),score=102.16 GHVR01119026.1:125-1114(+)